MVVFHHVNLAVGTGQIDAEAAFLTDVIGVHRVTPAADAVPAPRWWFETDDGKQIHLSEDPDHRPAARAHVAVEVGPDLPALERALERDGIDYRGVDNADGRVLICQDPGGNRWELRGTTVS